MGLVILPKSLVAKTEAKASDVMADLNALVTQVNGKLDLTNLAESLRNALIPTGSLIATARASAPTGFLLCEGQAVSRATYATLFAAIGTTYGNGDGATTFNLPDFRGSVLVGVDAGSGRLTLNNLQGQRGGHEELQQHNHSGSGLSTGTESVFHTHNLGWYGETRHEGSGFAYPDVNVGPPSTNTSNQSALHIHAVVGNTSNAGIGNGKNMPPYQTARWLIKI